MNKALYFSHNQLKVRFLLIALFLFPLMAFSQRVVHPSYVREITGLDAYISETDLNDETLLENRIDFLLDSLHLTNDDYDWHCLNWFKAYIEPDREKSFELKRQGYEASKKFKNKFIHRSFVFMLATHYNVGEDGFEETLPRIYEGIELAKKSDDAQWEFDAYFMMTKRYIDLEQAQHGYDWLARAEKALSKVGDPANYCNFHLMSSDIENTEVYDDRGLVIWNSKEQQQKSSDHCDKAIHYAQLAAGTPSEQYIFPLFYIYHIRADQAISIQEKIDFTHLSLTSALEQNYSSNAGQEYLRLARCHVQLDQPVLSKKYLDSAKAIMWSDDLMEILKLRIYSAQIDYFQYTKNLDSTVHYLHLYYQGEKKIRESESLVQLELNESKFEDAQQKLTIQDQETEILKKEKRAQNLVWIVASVILLAIIALIFYFRTLKRKKQIESMVMELEDNVKEKITLIQEVNHRVKNNLQMITAFVDAQSKNSEEKETIDFSDSIRKRIRAVSLVHELIVEEDRLSGMPFKEYVQELVQELESLHSDADSLECEIDFISVIFDLSSTMYLGVLLNELLTNSFKHATKEGEVLKIELSLVLKEDKYLLYYKDSGDGISEEAIANQRHSKSIGLSLIRSMASQMEGELSYSKENCEYTFEFPKPEYPE